MHCESLRTKLDHEQHTQNNLKNCFQVKHLRVPKKRSMSN